MTITAIARNFNGNPNIVTMVTTSTLSEITTAGFLTTPEVIADINALQNGEFVWELNDYVIISYSDGIGAFTRSDSTNSFSAITTGAGNVNLPTAPGRIAIFMDTIGTLGMVADPAFSNTDIQAGFDGSAGDLISYPPVSNTGRFVIRATGTSNDSRATVTNSSLMNQSTTYEIPDAVNTNAKLLAAAGTVPFVDGNFVVASGTVGLVKDSGAKVIAGTTPTYAGGGTTNNFTIAGMTSNFVGACSIKTSTNDVSITKATPGAGILAVTFSGDPGASTSLTYSYFSASLT